MALIETCDTSETSHIQRLVALAQGTSPITGVWHAAGMLADGVLPKQSAASLARVWAPKARGASALLMATWTPLHACVLFSSAAALLGGAGQANYSAANACLDAFGADSRSRGRACVSVQWAAWAEVGMAARGAASQRMAAIEVSSGFGRIGLAQGLGALDTAVLPRTVPLLGVVPVQWHRMSAGGGAVPAFWSEMVPQAAQGGQSSVQVQQATACTVVSLEMVVEMAMRTAGSAIDADAPLMEAGVDSLGAVELRNQLQRAVGDSVMLSSTLMFDHPTARQVALHLQGSQPAAAAGSGLRGVARVSAGTDADVEVSGEVDPDSSWRRRTCRARDGT